MPERKHIEPPLVVILAGGLGTRMRDRAGELPKALVEVAGEPFAHHQLRLLAGQGVREVVFVIGFRGEKLRAAIGDGSRFGLSVGYVDEGEELHGTGGALRYALDADALTDPIAVLYGDSYLPIELAPVWAAFAESGRLALMTVLRNEDRWDRSNAVVEDDVVVLYDKRPEERTARMAWIDYGLTVLSREVVEDIARGLRRRSRRCLPAAQPPGRSRRVRDDDALLRSRLARWHRRARALSRTQGRDRVSSPSLAEPLSGARIRVFGLSWWAVAVWVGATVYAVLLSIEAVREHHRFETFLDLAVYDQLLWLLANGHEPFSTVISRPLLGGHFQPGVVLLTPLYWLDLGVPGSAHGPVGRARPHRSRPLCARASVRCVTSRWPRCLRFCGSSVRGSRRSTCSSFALIRSRRR